MSQTIQMYDPKREYFSQKENIDNAINTVLNHGLFINGPEVKQLEASLKDYVGVSDCICVSNGTDALKLALLALDITHGDEVITVAHSWISTAEVIPLVGATPVFIDIDPETFNMDASKLESAISSKTKAIIVVSLYGQMADIDTINTIATKYDIPVIEDGAQSFGATYNGKRSCSLTTIGTTSFFPSKPLGCYGDGGACFTNDPELGAKLRAIKNHGGIKRFHHKYIGLNARLDTIQAAILNVKLPYFEETIKKRQECANYYSEQLQFLTEKGFGFKLPTIKDNCTSVWAQYAILANNKEQRDSIVDHLKNNNVNAAIFYPAPLHSQECFQPWLKDSLEEVNSKLINTNYVCDRVFNLPCYGEFTRTEQDIIVNLLKDFLR